MVREIEPGDWLDIDEYVAELREAGYTVRYENHWDGTSGFFAEVFVNDQSHAFIEGTPSGHLVKDVEHPVSAFGTPEVDA